jgi:hypothetical protein
MILLNRRKISPSGHSSSYGASSAKINAHLNDVESYKQLNIQFFYLSTNSQALYI